MRDVPAARKVAVVSDVHGNAPALAAVLVEIEREQPDLIVFGGDLTWGPLPGPTLALITPDLSERAVFIRGNADRRLLELADGRDAEGDDSPTEREQWLSREHAGRLDFLRQFVEQAVVEIEGLGAVRFCHGSPRTDEECVTPRTPVKRLRELREGVSERIIVTAHTHLQFDRKIDGMRSINPGSVGMPYEEHIAAYWALLGPDVDLRATDYDVEETLRLYRASADPLAERPIEYLVTPPSRDEVIEDAETRVFAG